MKVNLLIIVLLFQVSLLYSNNIEIKDNSDDKLISFKEQKLSFTSKKYFDKLYPDYNKKFEFFQGTKKITQKEFESLTNDPLIIKNNARIKEVKLAGFTGAIALGASSVSFLIPSIIFIALQTQYYNRKDNLTVLGYSSWIDYFIAKYPEYFLPGIICIALTITTALSILVDLTITFALLHKYQNNERIIKDVIERYNKKLKENLKILPEIGINGKNELIIGFSSKI
ncbi:MAG TPA: hypothetical protein PK771_15040 [Spirochaetota bacterium]|nr:hypothetical protein [Spirochaetota bacterium]